MKLKYISLLFLPALAVAADTGESGGTDIWWRLFNFIIFFGILYYLVADKIKAFFKGREEGIAGRLSEVQDRLKEAKAEKEAAAQKAKDAESTAADLVESAKKEAALMTEKIHATLAQDKLQLEKSFSDRVEIESKKMKKEVVDEVLEEMFASESAQISNDDLLNIIKKKVA